VADKNHLEIAKAGAKAIAEWRKSHPDERLELSGADLRRARLEHSDLRGADFSGSDLQWADLRWADLMNCDLSSANLMRADFHKADLENCDMSLCNLTYANLEDSNLNGAQLQEALFGRTRLFNTNLSVARGLDTCTHADTSFVDRETLSWADSLPDVFLTGIGVLSGFRATVIRVAVGSPSDVSSERQKARESIYEWNDSNAAIKQTVLLPVLWEYHGTPELGSHPQTIIDKRLLRNSQILVAIFWSRLGSPTPEATSGTVGEIERFLSEKKPVLLYFCTKPIPPDNIDSEQWDRLLGFKKSIQDRGLIGSFETLGELDRKLKQHLSETIDRIAQRV